MDSTTSRLTVFLRTILLALLGIPTTCWFNSMKAMSNHWVIFWGSNAVLIVVVLLVYLFPPVEQNSPARRDPFLYGSTSFSGFDKFSLLIINPASVVRSLAFSLFSYTAVIDLCIALELNAWISNSMLFYFKEVRHCHNT